MHLDVLTNFIGHHKEASQITTILYRDGAISHYSTFERNSDPDLSQASYSSYAFSVS